MYREPRKIVLKMFCVRFSCAFLIGLFHFRVIFSQMQRSACNVKNDVPTLRIELEKHDTEAVARRSSSK